MSNKKSEIRQKNKADTFKFLISYVLFRIMILNKWFYFKMK